MTPADKNQSNELKLLPCPICDGQAKYFGADLGHRVTCLICGLDVYRSREGYDSDKFGGDSVISIWNTRTRKAMDKFLPCREAFERWSKDQGWEIEGEPDARQRWIVWKAAWNARAPNPNSAQSTEKDELIAALETILSKHKPTPTKDK